MEFTPFQLTELVAHERDNLQALAVDDLRQRLLDLLAGLSGAGASTRRNPRELSRTILQKAARTLKIDTRLVAPEEVERLVFEQQVTNLVAQIQEQVTRGGPEMEARLEEELRDLLARMSAGEQEAIREAMGLDRASARAMLSAFKSGSLTVVLAGGLNSLGFGLFLAISTMAKALTLLTGVGLSFGFYAATSTFLGFMLGPVGVLLSFLTASGTVGAWHFFKLRRALLVNLVATMHYRLNT